MPRLNQYDYIFAIGTIFAALDAYNIGANDVANSFATSVSSRSLTLRQACVLAGICEFLGAVLVGAKVSGTIKNGIISLSTFQGNAGVEMLAFTCAITASASWLMVCTIKKWPVSTTYSIVSALLGVGVATGGWDAPRWGWNGGKGVATIFAGFGIAPAIAAGFASTVYLITKFIVLVRNNPVKWGLIVSPVYFFTVAAVLTMSIVYKGAPDLNLDDLPQSTIALAIVLTGLVIAILSALFWLPFVHCTVVKKDYTLRWYHVFYGPLLWKRPAPEPIENSMAHVTDYRVHRRDDEHHETSDVPLSSPPSTAGGETETKADPEAEVHGHQGPTLSQRPKVPLDEVEKNEHSIEGFWWLPKNLWIIFRYKIIGLLLHGSGVDIHAMQADGDDKMAQRLARMHERSHQYANETEHLYSFLQVMTACTASFAHGSNDVSNAIGPFAAIYQVWNTGRASSSSTPTPTWMLAFGAGMIVVGLATYGYNIMAVLGNRLTMHSPSRGFSMELGASITVLLASQFAIPVSSTMCIVGATAGVGIVSNGFKAVNWRTFGWIFLGWVITVPAVSIAAGCLMGIILNAPRF